MRRPWNHSPCARPQQPQRACHCLASSSVPLVLRSRVGRRILPRSPSVKRVKAAVPWKQSTCLHRPCHPPFDAALNSWPARLAVPLFLMTLLTLRRRKPKRKKKRTARQSAWSPRRTWPVAFDPWPRPCLQHFQQPQRQGQELVVVALLLLPLQFLRSPRLELLGPTRKAF